MIRLGARVVYDLNEDDNKGIPDRIHTPKDDTGVPHILRAFCTLRIKRV